VSDSRNSRLANELVVHGKKRLESRVAIPRCLSVHVLWSRDRRGRPDLDARQKVEIVALEIAGLVELDPRSVVPIHALTVHVHSFVDLVEEVMRLPYKDVALVLGEKFPVVAGRDWFPASKEPVSGDEHLSLLQMSTIERRRGDLVVGIEEKLHCLLA
jgi:hypothetical protein